MASVEWHGHCRGANYNHLCLPDGDGRQREDQTHQASGGHVFCGLVMILVYWRSSRGEYGFVAVFFRAKSKTRRMMEANRWRQALV